MLWGAEVEPPRVLAIREQRNEAQRLGIGEGRGENPKNSHKGVGWCEFRTRELGGANFSQCTIHLCKMRNLWFLQMAKIFGF